MSKFIRVTSRKQRGSEDLPRESQLPDLEPTLETTLTTENQLQNLLKRKEENNAAVETKGQEIINKFEGEKTKLIQKLNTAENGIKPVSETAEQLQKDIKILADRLEKATTEKINLKKSLLDFTSKNKNLEEETTNSDRSTRKSNNVSRKPKHPSKTIIYLEQENQQIKRKTDVGVTQDDEETFKNITQKTFANTSKKNPKDDDIPATEQEDEDAKRMNRYFNQPIVKALGENDVTIAAADQYEKRRPVSGELYSRSRDSRVRFTDRHTSGESNRDRSLSRSRDSSPYHVSDYHSSGRRDRNSSIPGHPDIKIINAHHTGTDLTVDREITTDPIFHQITTTGIKCVITATNIYSNSITLATILEPLKIGKSSTITVNRIEHIARECWKDMARTNNPGSDVEVEIPKLIRILINIFNKDIIALVDTGAAASLISSKILDTLENNENLKQLLSTIIILLTITFFVMNNINEICILGLDFLSNYLKSKINTRNRQICYDHFGVEHNFGKDKDLTQRDYRNLKSFTQLDFNNKTEQLTKIA
ncbi:Uncharacterized protein APZ42_031052 [Daphnia magna]|uniref:Uncharacterized protein n=1 Tax=Daphnia magna TaxID=35525 RepID=A0A162DCB3_9CRUS|nr:Uncharacterized protein APZ42_031052 [Daphnia magna]